MNYPDFSPQGYQVISELGRNREGGRIAWLAIELNTSQQVVIKQFCFAQVGSNWSAYKEHEREIQVLQGLNHPGIPKYLGVLETPDGFCLIQEYKNAPNLAVGRSFDLEEIKLIAVRALEILVYLQNRIPPVIHRDIKPENILVDEQFNVYLIDFGMSRIGSQEVAASSVFNGTPGFIPPEQIRKPTVGSDLYGLGATLICLLTGTKSTQIQNLTNDYDPYVINFRHLLPQLSLRFLNWLELMVKPRFNERFADAQTALDALKQLDLVRVPGVELSTSVLEFTATRLGERLRQTITVENPIPDTMLEGKWEVAPHPQDPPHTPNFHPWIFIDSAQFRSNDIKCAVLVDTSKLMADKLYKRRLLLRSNADVEIHTVTVHIKTAPLPIARRTVPYAALTRTFLFAAVATLAMSWGMAVGGYNGVILVGFLGTLSIAIWGGFLGGSSWGENLLIWCGILGTISSGISALIWVGIYGGISEMSIYELFKFVFLVGFSAISCGWCGVMLGHILNGVAAVIQLSLTNLEKSCHNKSTAMMLMLLTAGLGIGLGIGYSVGFLNPYILLAISATGLPLATILVYPPLKRRRLIAQYRQSEERLIKP
ncbi:serine/threonine protein kinase [Nodularia spumigena]|uniref:serine/threonine protein kinase n=1 Tax=Nodularia spumigena TaxID=70799 RepID=UPI00232B4101|nr:serine/threonine-protein kinase [Nodularia spumigena]MDB9350338.1 serine/threonine-protein kinase [Nodularia spumigena CS-588/01]MDB9351118.1 serine/threonine-protein kinase [Nodularia spumigena CS-588/05]